MAGLKSAFAQGVKSGRLMAPTDLVKAKELLATSGLKAAEAAAMLKVSERTLFRELRAARDREEWRLRLLRRRDFLEHKAAVQGNLIRRRRDAHRCD